MLGDSSDETNSMHACPTLLTLVSAKYVSPLIPFEALSGLLKTNLALSNTTTYCATH